MKEGYRLSNHRGENSTKINPIELQTTRRELFSQYFQLAEQTAKELDQPIKDILKEDLANALLPQKIKEDQVRQYYLKTPYGNFQYDADTLTATSPFLQNGESEPLKPIESIILEAFLKHPTRLFRNRELANIVDDFLERDALKHDNTVKWHISNLRRKLGIIYDSKNGNFPLIVTRYGLGYVFFSESNSEAMPEN